MSAAKSATRHCGNPMCSRVNRQFDWNWAIAMKSGPLDRAIHSYKYDEQRGWSKIFGRILLGFLERHPDPFRSFGLIVATPALADEFDHTREVLREAAYEDLFSPEEWPFDVVGPPAMILTEPVRRFAGKTFQQRLAIADEQLRKAIKVVDPKRIAGKDILVYDDVFTTGLTLNTVATVLKANGAGTVCGVSLVRAPFRGRHS
jgi:predicted amidophosphoribosyltransferase